LEEKYKTSIGNPDENRPLERSRCRCKDNIRISFAEILN
jgi:hypothetical protein